jgi:hypothetical protein
VSGSAWRSRDAAPHAVLGSRAWAAGFLGFLSPGLGQLFEGPQPLDVWAKPSLLGHSLGHLLRSYESAGFEAAAGSPAD